MGLHLQLFGVPRVLLDDRPIQFDTRKAVALLAHLAVTGTPQRRDSLAALLWPESDQGRARATLRRTLSVAGAVGPALRTAGPEVWLDGATCDVTAFEEAIAEGGLDHLQRAVELARGPFLEGFALRDSPAFDDWQALTADRLRDARAEVHARLAAAAAARGDTTAAVGHARARLALDALAEPAHRDLMCALALAGDRPAALRQYRALIRVLDRELGVPPLPATAELADAIRRAEPLDWPGAAAEPGRAAGRAAPGAPAHPGVGHASGRTAADGGPLLLDRDRELGDLLASWRSAEHAGAVVGVTGEAGIGRSALLAALGREVARAGGRVLAVRGRESERHLGLATIGDLVAPLVGEVGRLGLAEALGGLVGPSPLASEPGPGVQRRRLEAVLDLLAASVGSAPSLLVVDDAHLVDAASAEGLAYVLHRLPAGVCAVLSWPLDRAGALLPRALRELDGARVLRLPGIGPEAVGALAGADRAVGLWERTSGLPRLVLECLASDDPDAADDLRALVGARLDRASPEALQVLAAAAVLGGPADPELLRVVSGRDPRGTVDGIEEALGLGLLLELGASYELPHDTVRGLVEERTSLARRALLHARAGDHLARHAQARGTHPALVAGHYSAAGSPLAAGWHAQAARLALRLRADQEALMHLALAGAGPSVAVARGEALVRLGRYDEALAALEGALADADLAPGPRSEVMLRLAEVHDRLGEWLPAHEWLLAAQAVLPSAADPLAARLRTDLALSAYRMGDLLGARAQAEPVADGPADAAARARALNVLGMVALAEGSAEEGLAAFERSAQAAAAVPAPEVLVAALHNQSRALQGLGREPAALEVAERALAVAEQEADLHRIAVVASHLADVLHGLGRTQEALAVQAGSAQSLARVALPAERPQVWLVGDW